MFVYILLKCKNRKQSWAQLSIFSYSTLSEKCDATHGKMFYITIETVGRPMVPVRVTATGWMRDWLALEDWPDSITADSSSSGGGAGGSIPAVTIKTRK